MAAEKATNSAPGNFLQATENFLTQKNRIIFWVMMALTALFGILLFDGRMSFATDDATYILNALGFLKKGAYPNYQGALYPFFLAALIKMFGVRILLMKTFSLIFILLNNFVFYRAFRGRIPYIILFSGLAVFSINSYLLAYGSSTFTEALFMLFQSLSIFTLLKLTEKLSEPGSTLKNSLPHWLMFGFVLLLMSLVKNLGVFAIVAVAGFFILRKEWKYALLAIVFFAVFKLPYEAAIRSKFGNIGGSQVEQLMRKDFYDPSKGNVDASDLVDRFFDNFGNYFSVHAFKLLSLREAGVPGLFTFDKQKEIKYAEDPTTGERIQENFKPSFLFALVFIGLFGLALWQAFKYNKYMFYTLLYVITLAFVTFVVLQSSWNQDRLIVIYIPFIFMAFFYGLYELSVQRNIGIIKNALPIVIAFCLLLQLGTTFKQATKNSRQTKAYFKGDAFYGYPMAISNYLKACEWHGQNIHDTFSTLAVKPVEAAVFAGGNSFSRMPEIKKGQDSPDSLMAILHKKKIGYIITDEYSGNFKQLAEFLAQRYPEKIKEVYKEGEAEPASIVKINY